MTCHVRFAFAALLATLLPVAAGAQSFRRLPPRLGKDGIDIREAFAGVVEKAKAQTVEISREGKQVALGLVVGANGEILTKASELGPVEQLRVVLPDVGPKRVEVLGVSQENDLVLLRIDATGLTEPQWSKAARVNPGQWVVTADADGDAAAVGIVSVARRELRGVNGFLGIVMEPGRRGARITGVADKSAAAEAELRPDDEIVAIDGAKTPTPADLQEALKYQAPKTRLLLTVLRDGKETRMPVRLGFPPMEGINNNEFQNRMGGSLSLRRFNFPTVFQHDTLLEPDECGGPLLDLRGRVLGVNIARSGRTESYAIPADVIAKVLPDLRSGALAPVDRPQMVGTEIDDRSDGSQ